MNNELIYVYCISDSPPRLNGNMEFKGLESVMFDNFYVIVKYVSEGEFSEENLKKNSSDIQWLETHARERLSPTPGTGGK